MKSNIIRDLINVLSGNVIAQGIGFLIVMMVSKELGPQSFGVYSLFISIYMILCQIADFGISTSFVKYGSNQKSVSDYNNLFFSISVSKLALVSIFSLIIWIFSTQISFYLFSTLDYEVVIQTISLSIIMYSIFSLIVLHYHTSQNFKMFSFLNISVQIIKLSGTAMIIYVLKAGNPEKFLYIQVFSYVAVIIIYFIIRIKSINSRIRHVKFVFKSFLKIYKLGFWVFLSSVSVLIMMRLDIFMLQKMSTTIEVGYYSLAMQLAMAIPILTGSITTTLLPKVDSYIRDNSINDYISNVLKIVKYVLILLIIIEFLSPYVIRFIFGDEYSSSITVFQILAASFIVGVIFNPISILFYSLNKAHVLTYMNILQLFVNFVANLVLIPLFHSNGAALSTSIVKILAGIYIYYFIKREVKRIEIDSVLE